jgi:hypothetical protein
VVLINSTTRSQQSSLGYGLTLQSWALHFNVSIFAYNSKLNKIHWWKAHAIKCLNACADEVYVMEQTVAMMRVQQETVIRNEVALQCYVQKKGNQGRKRDTPCQTVAQGGSVIQCAGNPS